jgi:hypothetical protein
MTEMETIYMIVPQDRGLSMRDYQKIGELKNQGYEESPYLPSIENMPGYQLLILMPPVQSATQPTQFLTSTERDHLIALLQQMPFTRTVEGRRLLLVDLWAFENDTTLSRTDFNIPHVVDLLNRAVAAPGYPHPIVIMMENALSNGVQDATDIKVRHLLESVRYR